MAKTLLNGVNDVLKAIGEIAGDSGDLTTLTDSARQRAVDLSIQSWNEVIGLLYGGSNMAAPLSQAESTITLATGDRSYALATDLVQLRWPFIDKTNAQYIHEHKGGYNSLLALDPEQNDTGVPHFAAINPVNGEIHLDRAPTAAENGNVYTYQYDKDLILSLAADTMPFGDTVYIHARGAAAELTKQKYKSTMDAGVFRVQMGAAARGLRQVQPSESYNPRA